MNTSMQNQGIDPAALRLYYLQQLGVNVYVSRDAAAMVETPTVEAVDMPVPQDLSAASTADMGTAVTRKSLLDEMEAQPAYSVSQASTKPASPALSKTATQASASSGESAAIVPFQLLFYMPEPRLAVALEIPAMSKPVMQEAQARLLQNLLRWLGIKSTGMEAALLHFRWPLPGMPAGDAKSAGRNLQVFLEQAAATQPWQRLLLLGQGPASCLGAASADAVLPFQTWATHSLAEMLAVPALKREVWRHLLSLHDQL